MVHVQHVQLRAHAQAIRGLQKGLRRERELVSTGHFKTSEQLHIRSPQNPRRSKSPQTLRQVKGLLQCYPHARFHVV